MNVPKQNLNEIHIYLNGVSSLFNRLLLLLLFKMRKYIIGLHVAHYEYVLDQIYIDS